jgi:hypothetical protein
MAGSRLQQFYANDYNEINITNATTLSGMFQLCKNYKELGLGSINLEST